MESPNQYARTRAPFLIDQRLQRQGSPWDLDDTTFPPADRPPYPVIVLELFARLPGVRRLVRRTLLNYRTTHTELRLLRTQNDIGLRVLHLSDLHAETIPDGGRKLASLVASVECDLCVVTGDFRDPYASTLQGCTEIVRRIIAAIRAPLGVYAVLGNHDLIQSIQGLESLGVRFLLNQGLLLSHAEHSIWLAGVEDPHFYRLHDIDASLKAAPTDATIIMLAHSPELATEAAARGVDCYFCGHTHGGQVRLPWGRQLWSNLRSGHDYSVGSWQVGRMMGYTSAGVGTSMFPFRCCCPPEVTIHRLLPAGELGDALNDVV